MSVKVITDSTSYIPKNMVEELSIGIIPLRVSFDEETFVENEITNDFFYKKLDEKGEIPISSQPSIDFFYNMFEKEIKIGNEIVGVFISADMSGTFSTAVMVKNMILKEYPKAKIKILNSKSNSMQLGYAAIEGARISKAGGAFNDVVETIENTIKRTRFLFIPDTFKYLKKGGRIGSAQALLGSLLKIKPILTVNDGKTDVMEKIRTRKKAIEKMIDVFLKDIEQYGFKDAIIHHINCDNDAQEFADLIKEQTGKIIDKIIGPVIGTHVGPGAIGIVYLTENDMI